jgi:uncharacterized membrane protein YfcA
MGVQGLVLAGAAHAGHHAASSTPAIALAFAGLIVGFTVGLTGMGGGALMTPILVLVFGVAPSTAVSSDLLASLVMKPVGGGVHLKRGTVDWTLVRWLCLGSVPAAFAAVLILKALGSGARVQHDIKLLLGWALLVASVAMVAKVVLQARASRRLAAAGQDPNDHPHTIKPIPTMLIGAVGGLIVGLTSVGSGSLMIVLLMLLYPRLSARTMVGTDIIQAIPLVAAATLGHLLFGDVSFSITGALLLGCLPGVYLGARLSSRARDGLVRPALSFVLLASALSLLGLSATSLGYTLGIVALTALPLWGAIDATMLRHADWEQAHRSRTFWVALQGVAAPFGVGLLGSIVYFTRVRPEVLAAGSNLEPFGPNDDQARGAVAAVVGT